MLVLAAFAIARAQSNAFTPIEVVKDAVRVQVLTPSLVRIETKGPEGWEDRKTFTVVSRPDKVTDQTGDELNLGSFKIEIPPNAKPQDVKIEDNSGNTIYQWDGKPITHSFLPAPSENFKTYAIEDAPRIVPPAWGATTPPPDNKNFPENSGWDTTNEAPDIYVFLKGSQGYQGLRKDFLDLTGHTPMPPLAAFGLWDSRYYEYKQQEALDTIDTYRQHGFPLDFFVVDTDWRVNGSHGYDVSTKDFPDMKQFIADAHAKHVKLMYNDHPEPVSPNALAPEEFAYREHGLDELLDWGADVWWYDRNWSTHLHEPAPGIAAETWGPMIYHDVTAKAHPDKRPILMSNVQGIDNGLRHYAPHPAFHRYPIWWTGDTSAHFPYLQYGVENGVDEGVLGLLPYVNEDLGGHIGHPTPELYTRYLEYGALSPITRLHCTKGEYREPWIFGKEAEDIVRDYIKLRYRLLPTFYQAAHQAYVDGTPLLRRGDLYWPNYPEAASNTQYLLGDNLLIAPTLESVNPTPKLIPADLIHTDNGEQGMFGEYFSNTKLEGQPVLSRVDPKIDFDWNAGSPAPGMPAENFSIRWTGKLGPVPETGDYELAVRMDDGCRLFLDGKNLIDDWRGHAEITDEATVHLDKGHIYNLRLEYLQLGYDDLCHLEWRLPSEHKKVAQRTLWVPPGEWEDLWTGKRLEGPKTITVDSPLRQTAMYARVGGIILTAPNMEYTGEKPWDPITVDAYPDFSRISTTELYEDDGQSNAYLSGGYRTTNVSVSEIALRPIRVLISGAKGAVTQAPGRRGWIVRVHLPPGSTVSSVHDANLNALKYTLLRPSGSPVKIPFLGEGSPPPADAGPIVEVKLPPEDVTNSQEIAIATH